MSDDPKTFPATAIQPSQILTPAEARKLGLQVPEGAVAVQIYGGRITVSDAFLYDRIEGEILESFCRCDMKEGYTCGLHSLLTALRSARGR